MRKITVLLMGAFICLSFCSKAQTQFWIENWTGTTCAKLCHTYTGPNGTWTIDSIAADNGAKSNDWYFSYTEQGMGRGQCGSGTGTHATAHVGNVKGSPASILCPNGDCGASYDASNSPKVVTSKSIVSPVINCSAETNITLSFNYIQDGEAGHDNDSVDYFDGTSWSYLAATPITNNSSCSPQGTWTYYTVGLPASANNNSKVQISFKWTNDGNGTGKDPSFAVDSIILSGTPSLALPVAAFLANDTIICVGDTVQFTDQSTNNPTNWTWTFTGGNPGISGQQNPKVVYSAPGFYTVKLKATNGAGSDSITKTSYIDVVAKPVPVFSGNDSICVGDSTTITVSGGTSYLWANGATTSAITVKPTMATCYSVSVSNGVCSKDSCYPVVAIPIPDVTLNVTLNGVAKDTVCAIAQAFILGGGTPAGGTYAGPKIVGGNHIIPDSVGNYLITYTFTNRYGCTASATDTLHVVLCEGIQNISDGNDINLYPNPAGNSITLEFNSGISNNTKIDITDVAGRLISTHEFESISGNAVTFDVSGLATGMYFVKVSSSKSEYYAKFIKQ